MHGPYAELQDQVHEHTSAITHASLDNRIDEERADQLLRNVQGTAEDAKPDLPKWMTLTPEQHALVSEMNHNSLHHPHGYHRPR